MHNSKVDKSRENMLFVAKRYGIAETALIVARVKYSASTRINMQMWVWI